MNEDYKKLEKFYSGGFLYNPETSSILLHKRDANTKFNPNMWAFFGGLNEEGETPKECFIRELKEELNIDVAKSNVISLCDYLNEELNTYRYVFFVKSDLSKEEMTLGEGAGFDWVPISELDKYDLTEKTKIDIDVFLGSLL